jgi:hypothetical protein
MKIQSLFTVVFLITVSSSCYRIKSDYKEYYDGSSGELSSELKSDCEMLETIPELSSLLEYNQEVVNRIFTVLAKGDGFEAKKLWDLVQPDLRVNTQHIWDITPEEFKVPKYKHRLEWEFSKKDLKDIEIGTNENDIEIMHVGLKEEYRGIDSKRGSINFLSSKDGVFYALFDETISSLELCSLKNLHAFSAFVQYRVRGGDKHVLFFLRTNSQKIDGKN